MLKAGDAITVYNNGYLPTKYPRIDAVITKLKDGKVYVKDVTPNKIKLKRFNPFRYGPNGYVQLSGSGRSSRTYFLHDVNGKKLEPADFAF